MRLSLLGLALFCLSCMPEAEVEVQSFSRYTCLTEHLSLESYENGSDTTISWDPKGVILSKGNHHPVLTAIYGILCYERFVESGDSAYHEKVLSQASFFMNPEFQESAFDGKGIRFAYDFDFHDLKAPWYSGMAQGMGVSLLLRYKALTGDQSVDDICKKLIHYMLQPDFVGGTLGRLDSGEPWIEEYPRSEDSPHVLNGSINAWIGLHEYCKAFPKDENAREWRDTLLLTFENNLDAFTMNWWCRYDLGKRACAPSYVRYHIYQMEHLNELTGKSVFKLQEAMWACFLNGKEIEPEDRFSNKKYNLAVKAVFQPNHWCLPDYEVPPSIGPHGVAGKSTNFATLDQLKEYLDNGRMVKTEESEEIERIVFMEFEAPIHADYISISSAAMKDEVGIQVFAVTRDNELFRIEIEADRPDSTFWQAKMGGPVPEAGYNRLVAVLSGANAGKVQDVQIGLYDTRSLKLPRYGFYRSTALSWEKGEKYRIDVASRGVDEILVFYRHAEHKAEVVDAEFSLKKMVRNGVLDIPETGHYQFLVVYKVKNILSIVRMLRYEQVK